MNALAIGSKITIKKICSEIIDKLDSLNLVDYTNNNFLNWDYLHSNKVKFHSGNIEKIETLINANLDNAVIVIVHCKNDIESLFVAQKSKINANMHVFVILEDLSLASIFESLGFIVLDSHNLKITKLTNKIGT